MEKVNYGLVAKTNARLFALQLKMLTANNVVFFKKLEELIEGFEQHEKHEKLVQAWKSEGEMPKSFVVGDEFDNAKYQYNQTFREQLLIPDAKKVVEIFDSWGLRSFIVHRRISHTELQKKSHSKPFSKELFWHYMYLLTVKPASTRMKYDWELQIGREYIFPIQISGEQILFIAVTFDGKLWDFKALTSDADYSYQKGTIRYSNR